MATQTAINLKHFRDRHPIVLANDFDEYSYSELLDVLRLIRAVRY
jgi:hypothetical protein